MMEGSEDSRETHPSHNPRWSSSWCVEWSVDLEELRVDLVHLTVVFQRVKVSTAVKEVGHAFACDFMSVVVEYPEVLEGRENRLAARRPLLVDDIDLCHD